MKKGISTVYFVLMCIVTPLLLVFFFGLLLALYNIAIGYDLTFVVPVFVLCLLAFLVITLYWVARFEQRKTERERAAWIDGVSHDIRTPLAITLGYVGTWVEDETLPDARRKEAEKIAASCRMVSELIADLNLTMRLEDALRPIRREKFSLGTLLRETITEFLNTGAANEVSFENVLATGEDLCIADRLLLKRAITNLTLNAERHGDGSGVLVILTQEKRKFVVTVENGTRIKSGESIAPSALGEDVLHGTGLSLVRKIAKLHHGSLSFETTEGKFIAKLFLPKKIFP